MIGRRVKPSHPKQEVKSISEPFHSITSQPHLTFHTFAALGASAGIFGTLTLSGLPGLLNGIMSGEPTVLNLGLNLTTALMCGSSSLALLSLSSKAAQRDESIAKKEQSWTKQIEVLCNQGRLLAREMSGISGQIDALTDGKALTCQKIENSAKIWQDFASGSRLITFGADAAVDVRFVRNASGEETICVSSERLKVQLPRHHVARRLLEIAHIYIVPKKMGIDDFKLPRAFRRKLSFYKKLDHILKVRKLNEVFDLSNVTFFICEDEIGPSTAIFVGERAPKRAAADSIPFCYKYELPLFMDRGLNVHDTRVEITFDPGEVSRQRGLLEAYMSMACRRLSLAEALDAFADQLPDIGDLNEDLDSVFVETMEVSDKRTQVIDDDIIDFGDGSFHISR